MSEYAENDCELLQRVMLEVDQGFDSSIRLQTEFFRFRDDVQGQAATIAEFRKLAERLYDILVALISLTVSDDGRQSQLAKVRLFNEDSQSPRNLFVKSGQVFIIHNERKQESAEKRAVIMALYPPVSPTVRSCLCIKSTRSRESGKLCASFQRSD